MTDNTNTISKGYSRPDPSSPAQLKIARKQRESAARFQERPDFELALRWRDAGDQRYTALPVSTKVALGFYANDRAAHAAQEKQS